MNKIKKVSSFVRQLICQQLICHQLFLYFSFFCILALLNFSSFVSLAFLYHQLFCTISSFDFSSFVSLALLYVSSFVFNSFVVSSFVCLLFCTQLFCTNTMIYHFLRGRDYMTKNSLTHKRGQISLKWCKSSVISEKHSQRQLNFFTRSSSTNTTRQLSFLMCGLVSSLHYPR